MDIPFEVDIKLLPRRRAHIPEELLVADEREQRIADLERDLATAQAELSDTIDAEIRQQARLINERDAAQARVAALIDTQDILKAAIDDALSSLNSSAILLVRVVEAKEALLRGQDALNKDKP